ncbi:hypothetical protein LguiB_028909 [Lonicera macranthoides]
MIIPISDEERILRFESTLGPIDAVFSLQHHVGPRPRTGVYTPVHGGASSASRVSHDLTWDLVQMPSSSRATYAIFASAARGITGNLQPPVKLPIAPRVSSAHNIRRPPITFQSPMQVHLSSHSLPSVLENADASGASLRLQRSNDTLEPSQAEQNWQCPTGLMRGSLTGQAYSEALAQFLNPRPSHPADRSLLGAVEYPPSFSPQM